MREALIVLTMTVAFISTGCGKRTESNSDQNASQATETNPQPPNESRVATTPAPVAEPNPVTPPLPNPIVVPAGTVITVKVGEALGSKTSHAGDSFSAVVASSVSVGGKVAIPTSSTARGKVVDAKAKGKVKGEGVLNLAVTELTIQATPIRSKLKFWVKLKKAKESGPPQLLEAEPPVEAEPPAAHSSEAWQGAAKEPQSVRLWVQALASWAVPSQETSRSRFPQNPP